MLVNISATAQIYWIFLCGSMTSHARSSGSAQYGSNHVTDNLENRFQSFVHSFLNLEVKGVNGVIATLEVNDDSFCPRKSSNNF